MFNAFLVDAHAEVRASNAKVLRLLNCNVTEFHESALALTALLDTPPPDMIFIDLNMEKIKDVEFFDCVAMLHPELPVIMTSLSSYPRREVLTRTAHLPYRVFGMFEQGNVKLIVESIGLRRH